jgi:tetratricopeptide (TPR) repeat protein
MLKNRLTLVIILAFVLSVCLLALLPRVMSVDKATERYYAHTTEKAETELNKALQLIENGQGMQGILKLVEITQEFPDFADAYFHLGLASLQTGQYEKSVQRFLKAKDLSKNEDYSPFMETVFEGLEQGYTQLNLNKELVLLWQDWYQKLPERHPLKEKILDKMAN